MFFFRFFDTDRCSWRRTCHTSCCTWLINPTSRRPWFVDFWMMSSPLRFLSIKDFEWGPFLFAHHFQILWSPTQLLLFISVQIFNSFCHSMPWFCYFSRGCTLHCYWIVGAESAHKILAFQRMNANYLEKDASKGQYFFSDPIIIKNHKNYLSLTN